MKRCDYCGLENEDAASHCSRCGTSKFEERPWLPFWTQSAEPAGEQISSSDRRAGEQISPSDRRARFLITTSLRSCVCGAVMRAYGKNWKGGTNVPGDVVLFFACAACGRRMRLPEPTMTVAGVLLF